MKVGDIADVIEQAAPLRVQEGFDNSGLLVGDRGAETDGALLCVDVTEATVQEALDKGIGMIIAHHPVIFHPLRHLTGSSYVERAVQAAVKHGIALYAAHTNIDNIEGGLSYRLADMLGVEATGFLAASATNPGTGTGIVGRLPRAVPTREFLTKVKATLKLEVVRHSAPAREAISTVAICSGSGASFIAAAKASGVDIYLAGDFKYNDFLGADTGMMIADIGHYESEYCSKEVLGDIIRKKLPTFVLLHSERETNPVIYFR